MLMWLQKLRCIRNIILLLYCIFIWACLKYVGKSQGPTLLACRISGWHQLANSQVVRYCCLR